MHALRRQPDHPDTRGGRGLSERNLVEFSMQGDLKQLLQKIVLTPVLSPNGLGSTKVPRMDAIDRKILAVLQKDASLSVAEIGNRVGLSSTPCWKRIQRLEADGVIQRRVAVVDQDKLGLGVTVFVSIETGDHSEDWLKRFAEVVAALPEVMEFYRMAGDVDYMLRVVVPDIPGYDAFYKKLISTVPLKNVTSRFAMEKIKSTTALPIP